ncbi:DNA polymerase beta-like protein [Jimgerdemannia flammicorona]|uniref:DNA polymerase beta-like protein n=1 Tax=Jimgerdemannia flammicorona TaxID=994334 RepID=A0A433QAH9_9FUNG|nr:DNA polymerase beta-like protein [Jimgerdemannia flammicorona]
MLSRLLWRPSSLHTTVRTLVLTTAKPASRLISESPNRDICDLLESLALMERNKGQYFKERAYQKAMRSIAAYPKLLSSGKEARDLPGVGESIAKKIDQFLETRKPTY